MYDLKESGIEEAYRNYQGGKAAVLKILFLQILSHLNFHKFLCSFYRGRNGFREVK